MHARRRRRPRKWLNHARRPRDRDRSARLTTVDRSRLLAFLVAGGSTLAIGARTGNFELTVRHACFLLLPLVVIAFPEVSDFLFRRSWAGLAHGGEGPTPAVVIRLAAWLALFMVVLFHQYWGFVGVQ